jgi:cytochrome c oxidase subunit IV
MDYRAAIISSCWLAVAIISSVYMWIFAERIGDIFFGVFLPVGLLVLVALIVTFVVSGSASKEK